MGRAASVPDPGQRRAAAVRGGGGPGTAGRPPPSASRRRWLVPRHRTVRSTAYRAGGGRGRIAATWPRPARPAASGARDRAARSVRGSAWSPAWSTPARRRRRPRTGRRSRGPAPRPAAGASAAPGVPAPSTRRVGGSLKRCSTRCGSSSAPPPVPSSVRLPWGLLLVRVRPTPGRPSSILPAGGPLPGRPGARAHRRPRRAGAPGATHRPADAGAAPSNDATPGPIVSVCRRRPRRSAAGWSGNAFGRARRGAAAGYPAAFLRRPAADGSGTAARAGVTSPRRCGVPPVGGASAWNRMVGAW